MIFRSRKRLFSTFVVAFVCMFTLFNSPEQAQPVSAHSKISVVPSGQTIGVKLKSAGIIVVGHHELITPSGKKITPGKQAKLQIGDQITAINGVTIDDTAKISSITEQAGQSHQLLQLTVKRGNQTIQRQLRPVFDRAEQRYRLGLYVRNTAAGVGTMTFYAPQQSVYGALGHIITDVDTQKPIKIREGQILQSQVMSIHKSETGEPGEKRAQFVNRAQILGSISSNTPFGIFGRLHQTPQTNLTPKAMPVGFADEVKEGSAQIWTVVSGQKVEKFNIEIKHIAKQAKPATKGLVIKITDRRLISKTGGIVQGMSGSPIIQDGKIVGAVTHVFVNDPTSGYGCFIEWMLKDAGMLTKQNLEAA